MDNDEDWLESDDESTDHLRPLHSRAVVAKVIEDAKTKDNMTEFHKHFLKDFVVPDDSEEEQVHIVHSSVSLCFKYVLTCNKISRLVRTRKKCWRNIRFRILHYLVLIMQVVERLVKWCCQSLRRLKKHLHK